MNPPPTCVITGATSGIGRAAALALASGGWRLVLVGRNRTRGEAVVRRARANAACPGAEFHSVDLESPPAARAFAAHLAARLRSIDLLINNAGARFDQYAAKAEGVERTFALNHLAHVILSCAWLPLLAASPAARIVWVTSSAAAQARPDSPWLMQEGSFDRREAYARAKLAALVFALELDRRLEGSAVRSLAWDPGIVFTRFARNNGLASWLRHVVYHAMRRDFRGPVSVARTLIDVAQSPLAGMRGELFFRLNIPTRLIAAAGAAERADELWTLSLKAAGLGRDLGSLSRSTPSMDDTSRDTR